MIKMLSELSHWLAPVLAPILGGPGIAVALLVAAVFVVMRSQKLPGQAACRLVYCPTAQGEEGDPATGIGLFDEFGKKWSMSNTSGFVHGKLPMGHLSGRLGTRIIEFNIGTEDHPVWSQILSLPEAPTPDRCVQVRAKRQSSAL